MLHNALHMPKVGVCLISILALWRYSKQKVHFDGPTCAVVSGDLVVATRTLSHATGLYDLDIPSTTALSTRAYITGSTPTIETWHRCLGHTNYQCIQNMAHAGMVKGLPLSLSKATPSKCVSCVLGKQTKTPILKKHEEGRRATRCLEIVWIDMIGPETVTSRTGSRYMLDILDDYTSHVFSIPPKTKDQAYPVLQAWQLEVEAKTGEKVKMYSVDNGTELKSEAVETWLKKQGTQQWFSAPYTSAHIGQVEQMHRTLMGKARAMCLYAKCPEDLWDKFYLTATHLHVKVWTCNLNNQMPYELWKGR